MTRTVLVTGASSGIGRATALMLAARGDDLVLVSRSEEALSEVGLECRAAGARAVVAVADVTDRDGLSVAFDVAGRELGPVDAVVHSAAVVAYGRFADVPPDVFDRTVVTGVLGTANVAREAMSRATPDRELDIVVVGSLLGRIAVPMMSSYVTSKWAVHGLVRCLQIEARRMPGVSISLVAPGGVDTPVYRQAGTYRSAQGRPPPPVDSAEKVARAVLRTLDRPRRHVSVGALNAVDTMGFRLLPGVYDRLVTPLMHRVGMSGEVRADSPGNVLEPRPEGAAVAGGFRRPWVRPAGVAASAGATVAVVRALRGRRR